MKRKTTISITLVVIIILSCLAYGATRNFIFHPSYMKWALFGGEYQTEFVAYFFDDKYSQQIVKGKTVDELKRWFPEMRSEKWMDDYGERLLNPDYEPQRETDVYITGVDKFAGIFIEVKNGVATKAYLLKDIPNQHMDFTVKTPVD